MLSTVKTFTMFAYRRLIFVKKITMCEVSIGSPFNAACSLLENALGNKGSVEMFLDKFSTVCY